MVVIIIGYSLSQEFITCSFLSSFWDVLFVIDEKSASLSYRCVLKGLTQTHSIQSDRYGI